MCILPPLHLCTDPRFCLFSFLPLLLSHLIPFHSSCAFPSHLPNPSSTLHVAVSLQLLLIDSISLLPCLLSPTPSGHSRVDQGAPYPGKHTFQWASGNTNAPGRPSVGQDLGQNTGCHRKEASHLP